MYTFSLFLLILTALYFIYWELELFKNRNAPFVCTPKKVLPYIVNAIKPRTEDTVMDLGCGDLRVLVALHNAYQNTKYIGVDNSFSAIINAYITRAKTSSAKSICIRKGNYLKEDLTQINIAYAWATVARINDIYAKCKSEMPKSSYLYSLDFPVTNVTPSQIINLHNDTGIFGKYLYEYKI